MYGLEKFEHFNVCVCVCRMFLGCWLLDLGNDVSLSTDQPAWLAEEIIFCYQSLLLHTNHYHHFYPAKLSHRYLTQPIPRPLITKQPKVTTRFLFLHINLSHFQNEWSISKVFSICSLNEENFPQARLLTIRSIEKKFSNYLKFSFFIVKTLFCAKIILIPTNSFC